MDNRKVNLVKNTTILAIGNFSSKLLTFFLVPLYTFYLRPADYGEIDIYITVLSMIYVIVSLQAIESAFRFIQDCNTDQEKTVTLSNALITSLVGIGIFSIGMLIFAYITNFKYCLIFILYVTTNILANLFLHTLRGMNKMTIFAVIGFVTTIIQVVCNIILIVKLEIGAVSLLWTSIITNAIVIVILIFTTNIINYCNLRAVSISVVKEQLKYSIPLIPNALGIWLLSSLGRFILLFYYGAADVGLLAFTLKFPLLLATVNSIFFMAWQMSAISEYKSKDRDVFASEVFQRFSNLLLSAVLVILPLTKIAIFTIMGKSYVETWIYIPVFFFGVIFNSYAQFFNMGFFGAKKTIEVFYSVIISCIIYLVVGLVFAKPLYIFGVGLAYSISQLIYWVFVIKRVTPYMKISINVKPQFIFLALFCGFTAVYYINGLWVQVAMIIVGVTIGILANWKLVVKLQTPLMKCFKKVCKC